MIDFEKGVTQESLPVNKIEKSNPEIELTNQAISDVEDHEFRFGYEHAFQNNKVALSWKDDKSLSIIIDSCQPEDDIWYGNCVDDAWVSREFLKNRVGQGAQITVQKIESKKFVGKIKEAEHYRLFVEHLDNTSNKSIITEIDHSPFYRKTISEDRESIDSWRETDYIEEGPRKLIVQNPNNLLPMCEYKIEGEEKMLFFKLEINTEEEVVNIVMQEMDSSNTEHNNIDGLRYPVYFNQLDNPEIVLNDIKNNDAFKPEGPFGERMHNKTLEHIKDSLLQIVAKIPPRKFQ